MCLIFDYFTFIKLLVVKDKDVRPQEVSGSALLLYMWRWCTVGVSLG